METEKSNYDMILEAIKYLDSDDQEFVSIEWVEEHQQFFKRIRSEFPDLSAVNEDIRDMEFRNKAAKAETYARKIENTKYFDVINYCKLCNICYELYQFCEDEGELTNAFEKLIVTSK
jgi:hypothetical protein